jgi:hypothetical protein
MSFFSGERNRWKKVAAWTYGQVLREGPYLRHAESQDKHQDHGLLEKGGAEKHHVTG